VFSRFSGRTMCVGLDESVDCASRAAGTGGELISGWLVRRIGVNGVAVADMVDGLLLWAGMDHGVALGGRCGDSTLGIAV
jgi:hypothetical protein